MIFAAPLVAAGLLCGCGSGAASGGALSTHGGVATLKYTLTEQGCLPVQATVPAGAVTVIATNGGSSNVTELELQNSNEIIVAERENLTAGLSGSFSLDLGPGTYLIHCPGGAVPDGHLQVTGQAKPSDALSKPLVQTAVLQYRTYVEGETLALAEHTRQFVDAIEQGRLSEAMTLFGPTRIHYEAIEPVAESFPGLDSAIDARIDSPTVLGDYSKWTGFHRLEQLMWVKHTLRGAAPFAALLLKDVETLNAKVPSLPLSAEQLINGSVGLLNEIVNAKITGEEDRYSHTDLSDFQGNLLGSRKAFEYVRPALEAGGDAGLADTIARKFQEVQAELNVYRRNTPLGFALYGALTRADKVKLARQVGEAAEALSAVAQKIAS